MRTFATTVHMASALIQQHFLAVFLSAASAPPHTAIWARYRRPSTMMIPILKLSFSFRSVERPLEIWCSSPACPDFIAELVDNAEVCRSSLEFRNRGRNIGRHSTRWRSDGRVSASVVEHVHGRCHACRHPAEAVDSTCLSRRSTVRNGFDSVSSRPAGAENPECVGGMTPARTGVFQRRIMGEHASSPGISGGSGVDQIAIQRTVRVVKNMQLV